MFEHSKAQHAALADRQFGIDRDEGARRFVLDQLGARPAQDSSDPRLQRARAVLGNQSVIADLEADVSQYQQALPAGHFGLGVVMVLLYAAEAFGCYDILDIFEFAEESRVVVAVALAAVVAWMTALAGNEVKDLGGTALRSPGKRLVGVGVLTAFVVLVLALAFMRLSTADSELSASFAQVVVMLAASLGPAAALKALFPRFNEGRSIAQALKSSRTKLKEETTQVRKAQEVVEATYASPVEYDAKAAVLTARYLTEYDRAAGRREQ